MESKNMFTFLLFLTIISLSFGQDKDQELISEFLKRFSNINVAEILSNDRLFQAYHKCFLDLGPCTPDARDTKNVIPALVRSACESCTQEQKKEMKKHLDYAKHKRQKEWEELLDKFDPKRENLEKFLGSIPL